MYCKMAWVRVFSKLSGHNYLDSLTMISEEVDSDDRFTGFLLVLPDILSDSNVVVQMFLVSKRIQSFKHKLEQSFQILRAWTRDEDVGITVSQGSGNCQSKSSTLTTSTGCGKGNGR